MSKELVVAVVEDEPDVRLMVRTQLQLEGYTYRTIPAGSIELLNVKSWAGVDVALVDLMMPFISGRDVLMFLKDELPYIRRIAFSAARNHLEEIGPYVDATILKPYSIDELKRAIDGR